MSLLDAIKQSGLQSVTRLIGSFTLATDASSSGRLHIHFSNGESVLSADLGEKEVDELQTKLGLNNRQGVMNLIAAALKDLQPSPPSSSSQAAAAAPLAIPLAPGSNREAQLRLQPPANQSEARRRLFALVSTRARDLALELDSANRALETARAGRVTDAAAMLGKRLGGVAGGGVGKKVARTALPGMSLVNPMQRKRKVAKGVVFDDDDDDDDADGKGEEK